VFARIGYLVTSHAKLVLATTGLAIVVFGILGFSVFGRLLGNGFDNPSSGSTQAQNLLQQKFVGSPDFILLVHARSGSVDSSAVRHDGDALTRRLESDPRLVGVTSYWQTHSRALRSRDGADALILSTVRGNDDQAGKTATKLLSDYAHVNTGATTVLIGGGEGTNVGGQVGKDIARAESIAVPITLILLVIAFGSAVAALLPLSIGLVAILGAFAELNVMTHLTSVSVFAINLVTALGLGLGIDYALLMVSRFREELAGGATVEAAVIRTTETAGRTIAFSALTVAVALSAMLVFPVYFLKSFAYGGVGVCVFAALGALFFLPALLTVLGHRVNAGRLPWMRRERHAAAPFWGRLAAAVMRRPAVFALPVLAVLVLLAIPFAHVTFSTPDERVLPKTAPAHQVGDALRDDFATQPSAVDVVVKTAVPTGDLRGYTRRLSQLSGVQQVQGSAGTFVDGQPSRPTANPASFASDGSQRITVQTGLAPSSGPAQDLLSAVRSTAPPPRATVYVGGATAELVDDKHAIASRLPLAGLIIVVTSLFLLFLFTGSVVQPIRALIGNVLTLAATFGTLVWIFQYGHLSSVLGFTPTPTNTDMPVLLFCVAFGLSMDYEVFLISRIKELHDHGASNAEAVTEGLGRTGRIVSTAAALLAVSFFAFGTSHVSFIQFFGLGCGMAILIDATLVRGVLVPAFMRVFGEHSWWAPPPLRRLHDRLGLSETAIEA
jgi:putative drug exporter of the RND superfamily